MNKKKILKAVHIIFPKKNEDPVAAREILDDVFRREPLSFVIMIRLLFCLFWWMPLLAILRFKTLGQLHTTEQERYFTWWKHHPFYPFRQVFDMLKTFSLLVQAARDWGP